MTTQRRIIRRSLIGTVAAALLSLGPVAAASAHVEASSDNATRGGYATVSFQVPNESTNGAATSTVVVELSSVSGVKTETKPGWAVRLDREGGNVKSVTWTAAPDAGIPVDQFEVFRIQVKLPDSDSVSFPTTQTYADGAVVKWDQGTLPGGAEPEHPAPTLALNAAGQPAHQQQPAPSTSAAPTASAAPEAPQPRKVVDYTSRILAGAALLVGALGVGLALIVRRP
jgi:uncharacterized protein YcnI